MKSELSHEKHALLEILGEACGTSLSVQCLAVINHLEVQAQSFKIPLSIMVQVCRS